MRKIFGVPSRADREFLFASLFAVHVKYFRVCRYSARMNVRRDMIPQG